MTMIPSSHNQGLKSSNHPCIVCISHRVLVAEAFSTLSVVSGLLTKAVAKSVRMVSPIEAVKFVSGLVSSRTLCTRTVVVADLEAKSGYWLVSYI